MGLRPPAPRKTYGQHFLTDVRITEKIVGLLSLVDASTIVEIGPGRGALTGRLHETGKRVVAVESDQRLAAYLEEKFPTGLKLYKQDILAVDAEELLASDAQITGGGRKAVLVGNLPYNLSGPILEWIFRSHRLWSQVVLMLQLEVARRLVAEPQTRDFGPLTVARALSFEARKRFLVRPGAFFPPPKVTSAVVELTPTQGPPVTPADPEDFMRVVHALFAHRRKNMRNNLKLGLGFTDADLEDVFGTAAVDGRRRGEELTWAELGRLYAATCRRRSERPLDTDLEET